MTDVTKLKPEAQKELLANIYDMLLTICDDEQREKVLGALVRYLDKLDQDDYFSTEGWKHICGVTE